MHGVCVGQIQGTGSQLEGHDTHSRPCAALHGPNQSNLRRRGKPPERYAAHHEPAQNFDHSVLLRGVAREGDLTDAVVCTRAVNVRRCYIP